MSHLPRESDEDSPLCPPTVQTESTLLGVVPVATDLFLISLYRKPVLFRHSNHFLPYLLFLEFRIFATELNSFSWTSLNFVLSCSDFKFEFLFLNCLIFLQKFFLLPPSPMHLSTLRGLVMFEWLQITGHFLLLSAESGQEGAYWDALADCWNKWKRGNPLPNCLLHFWSFQHARILHLYLRHMILCRN